MTVDAAQLRLDPMRLQAVAPDQGAIAAGVTARTAPAAFTPDRLRSQAGGTASTVTAFVDMAHGPSKTPAEARQRLEAVVLPPPEEPSPYGHVETASLRPNEYRFYWRENEIPLRQALKDNQPLVAAARVTLTKGDQAAFDRLWKVAADDIGAQAALQVLLLEGTLTDGPASTDQQSLLAELTRLADRPLAKGLDRTDLICDLMQELGFPSSISQRHRGTCTVTSLQILTARERPAEYARLVSGLAAAGNDPIALADGSAWRREPGTEAADDSDRTASSRLFQAAAMEATFPDADYDNATNRHTMADGKQLVAGDSDALARLTRSVLGPVAFAEARWQGDFGGAQGLADAIIEAGRTGHPSLVALYRTESVEAATGGAGHEILVIGAADDGVRFINPWGQVETMTREALTAMVLSAVFVNPGAPTAPLASLARSVKS